VFALAVRVLDDGDDTLFVPIGHDAEEPAVVAVAEVLDSPS
jgi:hypothetical protein